MFAAFMGFLRETFGILEGNGSECPHAVHNFYGNLFDPDPGGTIYKFSHRDCEAQDFFPTRLWIFTGRRV